jgi:hypothetical protein
MFRYFRGVGGVALKQPAGMLYYGLASLAPPVGEASAQPSRSALSPGIAAGWTAVNLAGAILLVARGHER